MRENIKILPKCYQKCSGGIIFIADGKTSDGRTVHRVICSEGQDGGCKGPNFDELSQLSKLIGREHGTRSLRIRHEKPWFSDICDTAGKV